MAKFSEILTIVNGKNQSKVENPNGKYPIYGSGGVMGYADDYLCGSETVVIGRKGSINKPIYVEEPFWNVDTAFGLVANRDMLLPKYLFYFCVYFDFEQLNTTVTIPSLTKANLLNIEMNLPSLTVQKEIVERLSKVDELIALRKEQLAKLDRLVKSRFVELFGEVETNVKAFPMRRMDECCKFIGGAQPDKSHFEYEKTDDNIRLIQIRDYKSDRFITYIPKTLARKTCTAADIMIGRYGPPIFQILGGIEGAYNVALMKAMPTAEFNTEYFRYFLKSEKLLHYLESFSQRTAGQDGIQIDKLNAYPCFVPPMELQEKFAAFVEQTDKSKLAIQASLDKLETLKKSLMQEYFGQKVDTN